MHDQIVDLLLLADAAGGSSSAPIIVALIGAGGLVFGGLIQSLLSRNEREPRGWKAAQDAERNLLAEVRTQLAEKIRDLEESQNTLANAMTGMAYRDSEVARLREVCRVNGIDPNPPAPLPQGGAT